MVSSMCMYNDRGVYQYTQYFFHRVRVRVRVRIRARIRVRVRG